MKIKNILALGLIAIVSGISTAQTYTATAGTNGTTDIQSDYSQATGDGASVSVDVPLEFELPKKVAIAFKDSSGIFTGNSLFSDLSLNNPSHSRVLSGNFADNPSGRISVETVRAYGAIYSNSSLSLTIGYTDFLHESDPNSILEARGAFALRNSIDNSVISAPYDREDNHIFPYTVSVDDATLAAAENKLTLEFWHHIYESSFEPTDRAGKYISMVTITASTL